MAPLPRNALVPDISHYITLQAAPERVYRALTTPEGIQSWWTRDAALDANIGGAGAFRFHDGKTVTCVNIVELAPPVCVVWKTMSSNAPGGWDGTTISFDLRREGEDTALDFAHRGFAAESEGFARVTAGWAHYLASLRRYLENGAGEPHG